MDFVEGCGLGMETMVFIGYMLGWIQSTRMDGNTHSDFGNIGCHCNIHYIEDSAEEQGQSEWIVVGQKSESRIRSAKYSMIIRYNYICWQY